MTGTDAHFVHGFVDGLTRTERQLLMLHYAEELSPQEIGLVLRLSEGRVVRMLASLRERARAVLSTAPATA